MARNIPKLYKEESYRNIDYLGRDFNTLKDDLINYVKQYFPKEYSDFNPSSPGMMLLELAAYVGDNLGFYIDQNFHNLFTAFSRDKKTLINLGRNFGYKYRGKSASITNTDIFIEVPAKDTGGILAPDTDYLPKLLKGATFSSDTSPAVTFTLTEEINYAATANREIAIGDTDDSGNPVTYIIKKPGKVISGEVTTEEVTITELIPFREIKLENPDVIEIVEVKDANNKQYYEVDYLAQETIYQGFKNQTNDKDLVPYTMSLKRVPRRFVTRVDDVGVMKLVFGQGTYSVIDGEQLSNPQDFVLPPSIKGVLEFSTIEYDPSNYLNVRTLGIAPANTTLFIKYRYGGGKDSNVSTNKITTVLNSIFSFSLSDNQLDISKKNTVEASIAINNSTPAIGGADAETIDELRENLEANFATQQRAVTVQDYSALLTTMPSDFGTIYRSLATINEKDTFSVKLYVLSLGIDNTLINITETLRENVLLYLEKYRMFTDAIEIINGDIINIKVNFGVIIDPSFDKVRSEVLNNCIEELKDFFHIRNWTFNQSIIISQITGCLHNVGGVIGVTKVKISNVYEDDGSRVYSDGVRCDIPSNTISNVIKPSDYAIFQVKYPRYDIVGESSESV